MIPRLTDGAPMPETFLHYLCLTYLGPPLRTGDRWCWMCPNCGNEEGKFSTLPVRDGYKDTFWCHVCGCRGDAYDLLRLLRDQGVPEAAGGYAAHRALLGRLQREFDEMSHHGNGAGDGHHGGQGPHDDGGHGGDHHGHRGPRGHGSQGPHDRRHPISPRGSGAELCGVQLRRRVSELFADLGKADVACLARLADEAPAVLSDLVRECRRYVDWCEECDRRHREDG